MTIDAPISHPQPRPGEVRIGDVRAALGADWGSADHLVVEILPPRGGIPSVSTLRFMSKPSGRGLHVLLACPACSEPRSVLYADGRGGLGCRLCVRHRTRHQRDARTTRYRSHGGRELDRLLRLASSRATSAGASAALTALGEQLKNTTRALRDSTLDLVTAALGAAEVTHAP